jgi:hypothetical protein
MKTTIALLLLTVACQAPLPDAVVLVNPQEAAATILEAWGEKPGNHPTIWGVVSNCTGPSPDGRVGYGFIEPASELCIGSMIVEDGDIYLTVQPGGRYRHHLPHELVHHIYGDAHHKRADLWGPGGRVDQGVMALMVASHDDLIVVE